MIGIQIRRLTQKQGIALSLLFLPSGAGAASQSASPMQPNAAPGAPQVICRPCGEVPPPKGYSCGQGVMVADTVKTADIPKLAARCKQPTAAKKPCPASKRKKVAKAHKPKPQPKPETQEPH